MLYLHEQSRAIHSNVSDIRGVGLMQGIELVQNRDTGDPFPRSVDFAARVASEAIERGVWLYPCGSGPVADALLIGPPFTITDEHIEMIVDTTKASIDAAAATVPG